MAFLWVGFWHTSQCARMFGCVFYHQWDKYFQSTSWCNEQKVLLFSNQRRSSRLLNFSMFYSCQWLQKGLICSCIWQDIFRSFLAVHACIAFPSMHFRVFVAHASLPLCFMQCPRLTPMHCVCKCECNYTHQSGHVLFLALVRAQRRTN